MLFSYSLNGSGGLLFGERSETEVGLDDAEFREEFLSLLVADRGVDNDIITREPVDGGSDATAILVSDFS